MSPDEDATARLHAVTEKDLELETRRREMPGINYIVAVDRKLKRNVRWLMSEQR